MFALFLWCAGCTGAGGGQGGGTAVADREARRLFSQGNDHYASGRYEDAARDYRQLLSEGVASEAVHYNLANALFKLNQLGPAILELEKAAALAPGDPDVQANLEFLRSLTSDRTTLSGARTTTFFLERLLAITTIDEDAVLFTALYLIVGLLVGLRIAASSFRLQRAAVWSIAAFSLPLALVGTGLGVKLYRQQTQIHAIVLQQRVDVLSGPGEDNTTLFTVHEGLKVRIETAQGSWSQVSLENGLSGWVPATVLGEF
jgi:tetratricopeptide (TPR) repeat protein